jgi:transketolase
MEGVNHEAVGLAGTLGLGHLNVLWDDNKITIDGDTSLSTTEDILARYAASGWHTASCDGHDFADIARALAEAAADPRPSLVSCKTVIGKGAPNKQGGHNVHGSPLGKSEIEAAREYLGWTSAPFEIPADILGQWRAAGAKVRQRAQSGKRARRPIRTAPNWRGAWPASFRRMSARRVPTSRA